VQQLILEAQELKMLLDQLGGRCSLIMMYYEVVDGVTMIPFVGI